MTSDRFKFRLWCKETKKYYQDEEFCINATGSIVIQTEFEETPWFEDDFIVEQCTGLRDKHGKLIYEGDIVNVYDVLSGDYNKCIVTWDEAGATFFCVFMEPDKVIRTSYGVELGEDETEIIGNIHEPKFGIELQEGDSK